MVQEFIVALYGLRCPSRSLDSLPLRLVARFARAMQLAVSGRVWSGKGRVLLRRDARNGAFRIRSESDLRNPIETDRILESDLSDRILSKSDRLDRIRYRIWNRLTSGLVDQACIRVFNKVEMSQISLTLY